MQSLILESPNNPKSLKLIETVLPTPRKGEVRLKLSSIGLNRGDLLFCQGRYFIKPSSGSRLGFEGAGIIDDICAPSKFKLGDKVAICPMSFDVNTQGCLAEYGIYKEDSLIPSPKGLPLEHSGGIWMAYLTAWGGIVEAGQLKAGEALVITAASSSVGIAAIQIGNMLGAKTIATTTSEEKAEKLIELGAQHVIVQSKSSNANQYYVDQINQITHNSGSDLVFDAVAGPATHGLVKASTRGGRIVIQGMLDRRPMDIHAGVLMKRLLTLKGYTVDQTLENEAQKQNAIRSISKGFSDKNLVPVIAEKYKLSSFQDAFDSLATNRHTGKIIITP